MDKRLFSLEEITTTTEDISPEPTPSSSTADPIVVDKILLVNTENVTHEEYEQTTELKVEERFRSNNPLFVSLGIDC